MSFKNLVQLLSLLWLLPAMAMAQQTAEIKVNVKDTGRVVHVTTTSADGRLFALARRKAAFGIAAVLEIWDSTTGERLASFDAHPNLIQSIAFSPNGRLLASGSRDDTIKVWDLAGKRMLRQLEGHRDSVTVVAFSPDGRYLVSGSEDGTLKFWDVESGREFRSLKAHSDQILTVAVSPNGRIVASGSRVVKLWDAESGQELRTLSGNASWFRSVAFSPDGRTLASSGAKDNTIRLWDVANGSALATFQQSRSVGTVAFSPDGRVLAASVWGTFNNGSVKLWDVTTGRELRTLEINANVSAHFSASGSLVMTGGSQGMKFWDVSSGALRASIHTFSDGEWIAVTPEGYFEASPGGAGYLSVHTGGREFGMEQYRERFYRPDLVKLALAGRSLIQLGRLDQVKPAPQVEWVDVPGTTGEPQISVKVRLTDAGGGVGDVRLFLNGSAVVQQSARNLMVQQTQAAGTLQTYTVRLVNGRNELKAIAFNAENSMQSNPATAEVNATFQAARPSLHAVVVGIQEFKNPQFKLTYPIADAKLFAERLTRDAPALFQTVNITMLTTPQETTREHILQTLTGLRQKVGPEDLFVFFVASHGTVDEGEYFLLTSNVGSASTARLKADALSQDHLKEMIANIPATKKLVVIDTCNAGALGNSLQVALLTRGMSDVTAMKILGRAMGSTVLSASTSSQEAIEGYQGHGLFTYVVAEGLAGKADANKDGFVSTLELATYVDERVPALAEEVFKHAQYPVVSPSGQGFPLVKVR